MFSRVCAQVPINFRKREPEPGEKVTAVGCDPCTELPLMVTYCNVEIEESKGRSKTSGGRWNRSRMIG